jgi:small GTP-binding protein
MVGKRRHARSAQPTPQAERNFANYHLCVLGEAGVGKTAVTLKYVNDFFVSSYCYSTWWLNLLFVINHLRKADEYDPTIEDNYRKQVMIGDDACMLDILDTAGRSEFPNLHDQWVQTSEGFVLVYSVVNRASFDCIPSHVEAINSIHGKSMPICIVGNKMDLEPERVVSNKEGVDLARSLQCMFTETSAKTGENVSEIFSSLVLAISGFIAPSQAIKHGNNSRYSVRVG